MAAIASHPGRRLIIFLIALIAAFGGLALNGEWKPKLGLDLQGGTRITLTATTSDGEAATASAMEEARGIIDQRVNGSGVSESEVSIQGDNNVVVEIPGENRQDLVDAVSQTAQLRFRLVANACGGPCIAPNPEAIAAPTTSPSPSASPSGSPSKAPSASPTKSAGDGASTPSTPKRAEPTATPRGRVVPQGLMAAPTPTPTPSASSSATPSPVAKPKTTTSPTKAPKPAANDGAPVNDPQAWQDNPGNQALQNFASATCDSLAANPPQDDPSKPLIACDEEGNRYLLSASVIEGTELSSADSGQAADSLGTWEVRLELKGKGEDTMATISSALAGSEKQFAIVLDGAVISNAGFNEAITTGEARITGGFDQESAAALATSLKYGALPLTFEVSDLSLEGPTLAGDQLSAGLLAGAIGLFLVLIYCLFYYRGLGLVILASLLTAAAATYAAVLFLSDQAGFTLTLPGIAGLIVAVGITADSFIVYFERIRDEMREGKSMRVAVEAGWVRARNTCLAADAVSLLAAVVLYIFAIGVVKGFAFALGISTLIDLAVFFWFTKPMMSWLARFKFFYAGHKYSGLSADHIGIDKIAVSTPLGGSAR